MAAVIDDNATYGVGDMGSGGVEVRVATRDNGGAKSVTITTGRNEQVSCTTVCGTAAGGAQSSRGHRRARASSVTARLVRG